MPPLALDISSATRRTAYRASSRGDYAAELWPAHLPDGYSLCRSRFHQVSVTLLSPRGASGSSPFRRARFSASSWMGMAQRIGECPLGREPGRGNLAEA